MFPLDTRVASNIYLTEKTLETVVPKFLYKWLREKMDNLYKRKETGWMILPLENHGQLLHGNTSHVPQKHECLATLKLDKLWNIQNMKQYVE